MKTWKKWLIAVFSILLLTGITLGAVWLVDNWSVITSNTTLYTKEDLDNAYNKGLEDAGYDVILQYQEEIEKLNLRIASYQDKVTTLTNDLNQALEQNADDKENITKLENQIKDLKNQITILQGLVDSYEEIANGTVSITFYNDDIVVKTLAITKGNSIKSDVTIEEPEKVDYEFLGWSLTKNSTDVIDIYSYEFTENTTLYASYKKLLNAYTWNEIAEISASGNAEDYFKIGDTKTITFKYIKDFTVKVAILDFNHDDLVSGGKAGITFGVIEQIGEGISNSVLKMNDEETNVGGWNESYMRNTVLTQIYNSLEEELKTVIKTVNKQTSAGNGSSNLVNSSDNLFLFSSNEFLGDVKDISAIEGTQYTYFKNKDNRNLGEYAFLQLRSPDITNSQYFCMYNKITDGLINNWGTKSIIVFGFCV